MTDRPIIMSAVSVRGLLAGRKTQTRRIIKGGPDADGWHCDRRSDGWWWVADGGAPSMPARISYAVGDRLWVREAWQYAPQQYCCCPQPSEPSPCDDWLEGVGCRSNRDGIVYRADAPAFHRWRSPIYMPRWASRLTLTVIDVRVQRLQDISEADAIAEGIEYDGDICAFICPGHGNYYAGHAKIAYTTLWDSLHGLGSWDLNPWVCAVTFDVASEDVRQ